MKQSSTRWKTVQLPEELLNRVDKLVNVKELGYTSRSEFIKEAVRLRLEEVEKRIRKTTSSRISTR